MNCIIIDDDPNVRIILKSLIGNTDFLTFCGDFSDAKSAFNFLQKNNIDLIFLDIEMPKMNGLEFLESLQIKPMTIICSSKKDYAVDAYIHQAIDYILKPIEEKRFLLAVSRAKELFDNIHQMNETTTSYIFIKNNNLHTKINFSDILYIQAMGDYMKIFTKEKFYVLHSTMKNLENKLPNNQFFRIHRSSIINLTHLDSIEDNVAYVNRQSIIIGDNYKLALLKKIQSI